VVGVGSQAVDTDADVVVPDLRDLVWSPARNRSGEPEPSTRRERSSDAEDPSGREQSTRGSGFVIPRRAILPRGVT
jgi:hypothetical protein